MRVVTYRNFITLILQSHFFAFTFLFSLFIFVDFTHSDTFASYRSARVSEKILNFVKQKHELMSLILVTVHPVDDLLSACFGRQPLCPDTKFCVRCLCLVHATPTDDSHMRCYLVKTLTSTCTKKYRQFGSQNHLLRSTKAVTRLQRNNNRNSDNNN